MNNIIEIIKEEFEKTQSDYPDIIGKKLKMTVEDESEFHVKKIFYNKKSDPNNITLYGNLIKGNHETSGETISIPLDVFKKLYNDRYATWKQSKHEYVELQY